MHWLIGRAQLISAFQNYFKKVQTTTLAVILSLNSTLKFWPSLEWDKNCLAYVLRFFTLCCCFRLWLDICYLLIPLIWGADDLSGTGVGRGEKRCIHYLSLLTLTHLAPFGNSGRKLFAPNKKGSMWHMVTMPSVWLLLLISGGEVHDIFFFLF